MDLRGRSFIGWASGAEGGKTFTAINPAIGQAIAPNYFSASPSEVERAAELAAKAFASYSRASGKQKAVFLREIAKRLEGIVDQLVVRTNQEAGLAEARIRYVAERTIFKMRIFTDLVEEVTWVRARLADRLVTGVPA
jgi:NADP-dependent aldehyde dehydrogenase